MCNARFWGLLSLVSGACSASCSTSQGGLTCLGGAVIGKEVHARAMMCHSVGPSCLEGFQLFIVGGCSGTGWGLSWTCTDLGLRYCLNAPSSFLHHQEAPDSTCQRIHDGAAKLMWPCKACQVQDCIDVQSSESFIKTPLGLVLQDSVRYCAASAASSK